MHRLLVRAGRKPLAQVSCPPLLVICHLSIQQRQPMRLRHLWFIASSSSSSMSVEPLVLDLKTLKQLHYLRFLQNSEKLLTDLLCGQKSVVNCCKDVSCLLPGPVSQTIRFLDVVLTSVVFSGPMLFVVVPCHFPFCLCTFMLHITFVLRMPPKSISIDYNALYC